MIDRDRVIDDLEKLQHSFNRRPCIDDAITLLKADQAYLMWLAHALRMIADDTNLYKITESTARKPIDEMRDIALRGVPED